MPRLLKDISHQHMEGIQFLVLDERLQSRLICRPMAGQGVNEMTARGAVLLRPFDGGAAVGQGAERSFGDLRGLVNGDEWCPGGAPQL